MMGIIAYFNEEGSAIKGFDLGHAEQVTKEVLNTTGEWKEHAKLDRYEWYGYNEPGSQLNELKLFTYKVALQ